MASANSEPRDAILRSLTEAASHYRHLKDYVFDLGFPLSRRVCTSPSSCSCSLSTAICGAITAPSTHTASLSTTRTVCRSCRAYQALAVLDSRTTAPRSPSPMRAPSRRACPWSARRASRLSRSSTAPGSESGRRSRSRRPRCATTRGRGRGPGASRGTSSAARWRNCTAGFPQP